MPLFKKKKEEVIDDRTELEKTFEEKGQIIGRKTGKIVQKSVDKIHKVKGKLEEDGTMDKLRDFSDKLDDVVDKVVDKVTKTSKKVVQKANKTTETEEDFYE